MSSPDRLMCGRRVGLLVFGLLAMRASGLEAQQRVERALATVSVMQSFGAELRPFGQEVGFGYALTRRVFISGALARTGSAAVGTQASLLLRARLSPYGAAPYVGAGVMRASAEPSLVRVAFLAGGDLPWRGMRPLHIMAWPFLEVRVNSSGPIAAAVHGGVRLMPNLH